MEVEGDNLFTDKFSNILNTVTTFKNTMTTLQDQIRLLEKGVKKELKTMRKELDKYKKHKIVKAPSGFAKPTKVTNELCVFMNQAAGTSLARTDVTRAVIDYIELNKLQNTQNKQIIEPDEKLKILLGVNEGDQVTYFTLQKLMNKHFIKHTEEKDQDQSQINEIILSSK